MTNTTGTMQDLPRAVQTLIRKLRDEGKAYRQRIRAAEARIAELEARRDA